MRINDLCSSWSPSLKMLVLFETAGGFAIFKLLSEKKLLKSENLYQDFETPEAASKVVQLKHFKKFKDTTEALSAATAAVEGKMGKTLKKLLKKLVVKESQEELAVADAKLGNCIKEKLQLKCICDSPIQELMRGIRSQINSLLTGFPEKDMMAMSLGLAHSLSRYKLKFSPDKIDTMIVQAISLLDDLDKELNNYIMRGREWFGWHFPELSKIISDNLAYAKAVKLMGFRTNAVTTDFSDILPEDVEQELKTAAEISMGTEISDEDLINITYLCDQVIELTDYRSQLYEYLKNRMMAIAPNLTILVGELVGARLISHAGSLINLAKHPASTVQILGAEKALFRALKTKHDTPKYGLIYHASLVGQTNTKLKGKMSRMLAAKASLATRVDALAEESSAELGLEHRAKLENRLRLLEEGATRRLSGTAKGKAKWEKYENKSEVKTYNEGSDFTLIQSKKRKFEKDGGDEGTSTPKHKIPKIEFAEPDPESSSKKLKKSPKIEFVEPEPESSPSKKIKKSKMKRENETPIKEEESHSEKKKKKKKKVKTEDSD